MATRLQAFEKRILAGECTERQDWRHRRIKIINLGAGTRVGGGRNAEDATAGLADQKWGPII